MPTDCGEKVNNLSAAVPQAADGFEVYRVCGFRWASRDGTGWRDWSRRCQDEQLGAVTTFRWFFPQSGGFWSALASAWNAPAATYLGEHRNNFCWGGGTAIRRDRFEQCNVLEFWNGSVSDDFSLTACFAPSRMLRSSSRRSAWCRRCLIAMRPALLEFTNRQIIITRVYESRLWSLGGLAHALYCGAVLLGVGLFVGNLLPERRPYILLLLALVPPVLSMGRGVLRLAALMEVLPDWKSKLLADGWIWTFLAALAPFLALWNTVVALFSSRIRWRGIRYRLLSPGQTRILPR